MGNRDDVVKAVMPAGVSGVGGVSVPSRVFTPLIAWVKGSLRGGEEAMAVVAVGVLVPCFL
jgi:hypothetical protein